MATGFIGAVIIIGTAVFSAAAAPPPNFLVFFLDDHGWGDAGFNTGGRVTETPAMDKLAAGGMRFSDFHVGFSVCTASRAALLTGRTCPRTNVCGNFGPDSKHGMALGELTMANLLKRANYDTHMIGKVFIVTRTLACMCMPRHSHRPCPTNAFHV